ncbi:hypothetical protein DPEC_G00312970 [Dallia pectoralis]|uniref:Uncharacterized protein n=1 Tax=Dallia pectoralis TaxID=75939 RepID=A0ACC2FBU1_DALPE|nr:hypothetical protein DPEC_G00312970 [Dallia pectoralis]
MMIRSVVNLFVLLLLYPGVLDGRRMFQLHRVVLEGLKGGVCLRCSQNNSGDIYWYRRTAQRRAFTLLASLYTDTSNQTVSFTNSRYAIDQNEGSRGDLQILYLNRKDSGEYFCATSVALCTKIHTFLHKNPSIYFYPDHVKVSWKINDNEVDQVKPSDKGVVTDNTALWNNKTQKYSITSRLRVPNKVWHTEKNIFSCIVVFFNGTDDNCVSNKITGNSTGGGDAVYDVESLLKSSKNAKLAYIIFIAKSTFYGLVIMALIWKFKGSSEKHCN